MDAVIIFMYHVHHVLLFNLEAASSLMPMSNCIWFLLQSELTSFLYFCALS
jgi:hypothetical protein